MKDEKKTIKIKVVSDGSDDEHIVMVYKEKEDER